MKFKILKNCSHGDIGDVREIPKDIASKYAPWVLEEIKEVKNAENKAVLKPKKTKSITK